MKLTSGEIGKNGENVPQSAMRVNNRGQEYVMENAKEIPKKDNHATKTSHVRSGPNGVNLKLARFPVEMVRRREHEHANIMRTLIPGVQMVKVKSQKLKTMK